jgi:two-component system, chemotaxis family, chemotaxis protein CheY
VQQAECVAEALRTTASTSAFGLLITDSVMPEVDGLQLTRRFCLEHSTTPLLMVSDSLPSLRARREKDLECFGFLTKPFQINELHQAVRMLPDAAAPIAIRKS